MHAKKKTAHSFLRPRSSIAALPEAKRAALEDLGVERALTENTVVVSAKGEKGNDIWPQMVVRVNGVVASPAVVDVNNTEYQDFTFNTVALKANSISTVDVVFINDGWFPEIPAPDNRDRNLIVSSITVDEITYGSTGSNVWVDEGSGDAAFDGVDTLPGQEKLWVDAALRFNVTYTVDTGGGGDAFTVVVLAKGKKKSGIWPNIYARFNGVNATQGVVAVDSADYKSFTFTVIGATAAESPMVDVVFINYEGNRFLWISSIAVDGYTYLPTDNGVFVDKGTGDEAFDELDTLSGIEKLKWNAALRFPIVHSGLPPPGSPGNVTVLARGTFAADAWPEMEVRVNHQIASPASVTVDNTYFQEFTFTSTAMTPEPLIDVAFTNDAYERNHPRNTADDRDRNLFIDSIVIDGMRIMSDDDRVSVDWGSGEDAFDGIDTGPGVYALRGEGALRFSAFVVPEPNFVPLSTLR